MSATVAAAPPRAGRAAFQVMRSMTWKGGLAWSLTFAALAASTAKGFTTAYPTLASRELLVRTLVVNRAFQALYGVPHAADTPGGFTAWRIGTVLAVMAGAWMLLAATRLLRGEEDDGRWELLAAGATTPARLVGAAAAALGMRLAVAWVLLAAALVGVDLPAGGSVLMAGAVVLAGAVFAAAGSVASQLVPIRRRASALAGALLGLAFLVRVIADGTGVGWLRWASPFGWVEEVRAFDANRVFPLVLLAVAAAALEGAAVAVARRRDLGRGALFSDDRAPARAAGLRTPLGFGVRRAVGPTVVWSLSIGAFSFVLGLLTPDILKFVRSSPNTREVGEKLGAGLVTAAGYLGFAMSFVVLVVALYAGFRVVADREEEASGRLDNVLVRPVGRRSWLLQQGAVTIGGAAVVALVSAILAWAGAVARGESVPLGRILEGGLNAVPAAALFTGLGLLVLAVRPRATAGLTLGAIAGSYLVQLVGALVQAPSWVLALSVFHHVPPVPAVPVDLRSAGALLAIGASFAAAGAGVLARRDLAGA